MTFTASAAHPLAARITALLPPPLAAAFRICAADEVTSTNTMLKDYAAAAVTGGDPVLPTVLLARRQTGGRGRLGRSFHSPDGTGLYMSVLFVPRMPPRDALRLTTAAAVACAEAADRVRSPEAVTLSGEVGIKWVNDLYLDGKKICGILAEAALSPTAESLSWAVIGIGINVSPPPHGFPADIADTAGTLLPSAPAADTDDILARLVTDILVRLQVYLDGDPTDLLAQYRRRSVLDGRAVLVRPAGSLGGEEIPATVLGIDGDFGLRVRYEDGTAASLSSGEVILNDSDGTVQSSRPSVHLR